MALTVALVIWIFRNIETFFGYFLRRYLEPSYYFDGLGILVGVALVFLLGIVINAWIVRKIYTFFQNIIKQIPLIKTIYTAVYDLVMFFDKSSQTHQQAVLVDTSVGAVIGFVTRNSLEGLPPALGTDNHVLVYIPFSYQIGGFTLSIPNDKLRALDMPVEQAMSLVMTAGMSQKTD